MDAKSPERGEEKPKIVELGEEFSPFEKVKLLPNNEEVEGDAFILRTLVLPDFKLKGYGFSTECEKGEYLTPFDPEEGYQINQDDFDPKKRRLKFDSLKDLIDEKFALYTIGISNNLPNNPYDDYDNPTYVLRRQEFFPILQQLRLQLHFPNNLAFESRFDWGDEAEEGSLYFSFHSFYPLDTGPLPTKGVHLSEGVEIAVPEDLKRLSEIRGLFLLESHRNSI